MLTGRGSVNGEAIAREAQVVGLNRGGSDFTLKPNSDAVVLLLSDEPIDEPIVARPLRQ